MSPSPSAPPTPAPGELSVDAARAAIAALLQPVGGMSTLPLAQALGHVLAHEVVSPLDVPAHDNAAMDGYAFDGAALEAGDVRLRQVGRVLAGQHWAQPLAAGECLRIMTGAAMPPGLDTVVPLELCRAGGGQVHISAGTLRRGDHRRRRGEDLAAGRPALPGGRVLRPADLGLLASLGLAEVSVMRPLRVALFSTGDEIAAPGHALPPGAVYDSNGASLAAAIRRLGMEVLDLGLVRDDPAALQAVLHEAVAQADVVVTSGGVSAGDADHTRQVLARLGEVSFWQVALRPGRPFALGRLHGVADADKGAWLFALPGNPVAALVSFYALARDGLLRLAGATPQPPLLPPLPCTAAIRKRPGRTEYQRGVVARNAAGRWCVTPCAHQGAGVLRSMSEANAFIVLAHEQGAVEAGDEVAVWLFDGLL